MNLNHPLKPNSYGILFSVKWVNDIISVGYLLIGSLTIECETISLKVKTGSGPYGAKYLMTSSYFAIYAPIYVSKLTLLTIPFRLILLYATFPTNVPPIFNLTNFVSGWVTSVNVCV